MKYSYEIKLKAVKSLKKGILIKEPYNKISRHWRDIVKIWTDLNIFYIKNTQNLYKCAILAVLSYL